MRTQSPLAFALLDVDHVKRINDTYSHAAGDAHQAKHAGRNRIHG